MLDFSIRTVSDVAFGGQNIWWSAGLNLASMGVSELLQNYGKKIIGRCIEKYGACFAAGTPVVIGFEEALLPDDYVSSEHKSVRIKRKTITKTIEAIELGSRVITEAPDHLPHNDEFDEPDQGTWRLVTFLQRRSDGTEIEAELIRPNWWIELCGVEVGQIIDLQFPELQTSGTAHILGISDCPTIEQGEGRVVIGRFVTRGASNLLRVTLEDGQHLAGTTNHPVWSIDANAWKRLDALTTGERLLTLTGEARVASISAASLPTDVFNIEVHGEHVYRLLSCGLLAHNADCAGRMWYLWDRVLRSTPLDNAAKGDLTAEARNILGARFPEIAAEGWADTFTQAHHVIPLEYAHLFPDITPNAPGRIAAMFESDHILVSNMWTAFRNSLDHLPTASEVLTFAGETIREYGDRMWVAPGKNFLSNMLL